MIVQYHPLTASDLDSAISYCYPKTQTNVFVIMCSLRRIFR